MKAWPTLLLLAASSCSPYPDSYPPPIQRGPITDDEALGFRQSLAMNEPGAEAFFVRDIRALEGGAWRWTGPRPTLRFVLRKTEGLRFSMDFSVAGITFEQTGPVTVSVLINGKLLGRQRYDTFGEYHFEKPVDPSWLKAGEDTIVEAVVEPPWVAPSDGTKLGVILSRAGFVE